MQLEVQAFGAGIQSVALAILNVTGRVQPKADLAIMADPGSEEQETYRLLPVYRDWLAARGYELATVWAREGLVWDYIWNRSTVIPVYRGLDGVLGRRQCTTEWKVVPIRQEARRRGAKRLVLQLGISTDEVHRMRDSGVQWAINRYPLVELRLTRQDCRHIIKDAGLPVPPKSSCFFCPFQSRTRWQRRAIERPEEFEACARLEDRINERQAVKGKPVLYLSRSLVPLRRAFSGAQLTLDDAMDEAECSGYCFT